MMASTTLDHPQLGCLYLGSEGQWVGKTARGDEFYILADDFDDVLDPDCAVRAVRELSDLEGLLARIASFLAMAREPYLDRWINRHWEVNWLMFAKENDEPVFDVHYHLENDDYTTWIVRVEDGVPVTLSRR